MRKMATVAWKKASRECFGCSLPYRFLVPLETSNHQDLKSNGNPGNRCGEMPGSRFGGKIPVDGVISPLSAPMNRDSEDFIELLTGAQPSLYAYIVSLCHDATLAKDVLQDTNVIVWRKASEFEPGTHFKAWACRIAYFTLLSHRRKRSREQLVYDDDVFDYLAERQEQRLGEEDRRLEALRACISSLPSKQRTLIEARYEPGASVQRIAGEAGKSEGSISVALFRIRAALQQCIEQRLATEGGTV